MIFYNTVKYDSEEHRVTFPADANTTTFNINVTDDNILDSDRYLYLQINSTSLPDGVVVGYPSRATIIITKGKHVML